MVSCHPNRVEDPGDPTQCVVSDLKFKIDHVHMEIVIGFAVRPQSELRESSKMVRFRMRRGINTVRELARLKVFYHTCCIPYLLRHTCPD
jgi:hypothetical protein